MKLNLNPKPVNFKFGEYINKGFEQDGLQQIEYDEIAEIGSAKQF